VASDKAPALLQCLDVCLWNTACTRNYILQHIYEHVAGISTHLAVSIVSWKRTAGSASCAPLCQASGTNATLRTLSVGLDIFTFKDTGWREKHVISVSQPSIQDTDNSSEFPALVCHSAQDSTKSMSTLHSFVASPAHELQPRQSCIISNNCVTNLTECYIMYPSYCISTLLLA